MCNNLNLCHEDCFFYKISQPELGHVHLEQCDTSDL